MTQNHTWMKSPSTPYLPGKYLLSSVFQSCDLHALSLVVPNNKMMSYHSGVSQIQTLVLDDLAAPPAPSDVPPNFRAPDPKEVQSETPPLSAIEEKLQQVRYLPITHATELSSNQMQHDLVN